MNNINSNHLAHSSSSVRSSISAESYKVLKNTYALLSMTLAFSAFTAWLSYSQNWGHPGIIITLVGFYGLLFAIHKTKDSGMGLIFTFALTGFMGYTVGPIISSYVSAGLGSTVVMAFGLTASIFVGLSAMTVVTKKDFSFLSSFIMAGVIVLLVAMVANLFLQIEAFGLAISAGFALFSSVMIAYETSNIIHGGERNYVLATVTLFVSIYNLFLSLLNLLGATQD